MTEFIGAKISLISRSDIRYVGILHEINSEESTVALEQVRSFGTEGRRGGNEVPASDNVFEYIVFRGSDVKDLKIEEPAKKEAAPPPPPVLDDPAILTTTAPPPRTQQSPAYQPVPQYPPPPPGYGNFQYPPPPFGGPGGFRPPPQNLSHGDGFGYPNYPNNMPPPRGYPPASATADQRPQPPPQPAPPASQQATTQPSALPPSPVKETKPDVATATAPSAIKQAPVQPTSKPGGVVPAMPIPISIPVQPRQSKPVVPATQIQSRPQPPSTSPAAPVTAPAQVPEIIDAAKVTTVADVQTLAKTLSETKLTGTAPPSNNAPGAGGYLNRPPRRRTGPPANRPQMDRDYDFESANAKFNKEEVAKEVAAAQQGLNVSSPTTNGTETTAEGSTGPSSSQLAAALSESAFYDKGKSFFDNISCENKDRASGGKVEGTPNPGTWKRNEERKLNIETFGQASIDYGGGRYGRGGGGGYRGGRGGYRGGRGGRPRGGGGNPWRGVPRANGQNASETNTAA